MDLIVESSGFLLDGSLVSNLTIASIAVVLVGLVYSLFFKRSLAPGVKLPPIESGWPIIGNAISFGKHPLNFARRCYEQYGDIFTVSVLGKRLTFLVGPEGHKLFFKASDAELSQDEPYRFAIPIFGPGVVYDAPLSTRTQQLRFMSHSLKSEQLKSYVAKIVDEVEMYVDEKWGDEGEVDIRECLADLIILTASRCLMGPEIRENLHEEVSQLYSDLDEGLTTVSFFWPDAPTPAHRKRDRARLAMCELFSKVIQGRRENPEVKHDDVLQVFIDAKYRDGTAPDDQTITGLLIALLFAGQHTSSITSSWTGLLLMHNKEWLDQVLAEQDEIRKEHGDELSLEILSKMNVLHRCVLEALRMYPPLIFLMRLAKKEFKYKDFTIPEGDTLFVSTTLSGRVKEVYENPDTYDPDRFAPPREEHMSQPFAWIGFGGGRHGCMGEQFAYLQVKTIWSVLFRKFKFEAVGPLPEPDYTALVVGPKFPCKLRYKRIVPKK
eukprot:TRINITY_DN16834_c0_g1_i1.p1 TRINITY_DN16834_c0_g1~~TRINITY_DN16834_c0_g1_i1.p1  ORF type:complete len:520 (+),score=110.83 TRINITY_DN16834_c0_g1_i1:80-1561(+)